MIFAELSHYFTRRAIDAIAAVTYATTVILLLVISPAGRRR